MFANSTEFSNAINFICESKQIWPSTEAEEIDISFIHERIKGGGGQG